MKKKRKRRPPRMCPVHNVRLEGSPTRWGSRYDCPDAACDVMCWGGDTSTPADQATRDARHAAHEAFDPLWQGDNPQFVNRKKAYLWLSDELGIEPKACHLGMFDLETSNRVVKAASGKAER